MRLPELLIYLPGGLRINSVAKQGSGEGLSMTDKPECPWCQSAFESRTVGAQRKRFCSATCKNAYHTALRKWAARAADHGEVTVNELKDI